MLPLVRLLARIIGAKEKRLLMGEVIAHIMEQPIQDLAKNFPARPASMAACNSFKMAKSLSWSRSNSSTPTLNSGFHSAKGIAHVLPAAPAGTPAREDQAA